MKATTKKILFIFLILSTCFSAGFYSTYQKYQKLNSLTAYKTILDKNTAEVVSNPESEIHKDPIIDDNKIAPQIEPPKINPLVNDTRDQGSDVRIEERLKFIERLNQESAKNRGVDGSLINESEPPQVIPSPAPEKYENLGGVGKSNFPEDTPTQLPLNAMPPPSEIPTPPADFDENGPEIPEEEEEYLDEEEDSTDENISDSDELDEVDPEEDDVEVEDEGMSDTEEE